MITKSQTLAKLASDPTAAAQFDAASKVDYPGKTRPEVVELTLQALNLKRDKTATLERLRSESAVPKSKLAELKKITAKAKAAQSSNQTIAVTVTSAGIVSHSQRGGRAIKLSKI